MDFEFVNHTEYYAFIRKKNHLGVVCGKNQLTAPCKPYSDLNKSIETTR